MKIYHFLIVLFLLGVSCREAKKNKEDEFDGNIISEDSITAKSDFIKIELKDSSSIKNKYSYGHLFYKIPYDTLNQNEIEERLTVFVVSGSDKGYDFESILNNADDVLVDSTSTSNIVFPFKYKFSKIGENELKIAIKDIIYLKGRDSIFKETLESNSVYKVPVSVFELIGHKGDTIYYVGKRTIKIKRKDSTRIAKENQREIDSMKNILNN